jgi:hypothetical protein
MKGARFLIGMGGGAEKKDSFSREVTTNDRWNA